MCLCEEERSELWLRAWTVNNKSASSFFLLITDYVVGAKIGRDCPLMETCSSVGEGTHDFCLAIHRIYGEFHATFTFPKRVIQDEQTFLTFFVPIVPS